MLHREIHGFWGTPVVVSQETPNFKQLQVELVDEAGNYLQQLRPQMGGLGAQWSKSSMDPALASQEVGYNLSGSRSFSTVNRNDHLEGMRYASISDCIISSWPSHVPRRNPIGTGYTPLIVG